MQLLIFIASSDTILYTLLLKATFPHCSTSSHCSICLVYLPV